ncbi:MAG: HAD family hydrolase [Uliginosibacterium sp.]|nr:HAD family hydrolase [Uliginosibacterium sp.]
MSRKALFLDRDGVINHDPGYVHRADQVEFIDGIFELCRAAVARDYLIIIITNQAGIGRGFYTEAQFHSLMDWMRARFAAEGAPLTEVYFCPSHPEHGIGEYRIDSPERKPNPGMILNAQQAFTLDLAASLLIGDKPGDCEAGARASVGVRLLYDPADETRSPFASAHIRDLGEALAYLEPHND